MTETPGEHRQIPPLWPSLLLCAAVAVWVDLGAMHDLHHGDSLVPVLVSLYKWTCFFWDSDHVGMLVPLLASPVKNPMANLLAQCGANIFCGLSVFFLLARYVLRDRSYPVVGALGVATFLALTPRGYSFDFFISTLYGVALALGLAGLLLLTTRPGGRVTVPRGLAALGLIVLSHWVYTAMALALAPLVVFRALFAWAGLGKATGPDAPFATRLGRLAGSEPVVSVVLLGVGLAVGMALMRLAPGAHLINNATLPPSQWAAELGHFLDKTWAPLAEQGGTWALGLAGLAGLLLLAVPAVRKHAPAAGAAVPLVLAAATHFVYMGTRAYIKTQTSHQRYLRFAVLSDMPIVAVNPAVNDKKSDSIPSLKITPPSAMREATTSG